MRDGSGKDGDPGGRGIDAADALDRMMGSEALLVRFLGRFLEDATYQALRQAVEAGDWEKALMASHT